MPWTNVSKPTGANYTRINSYLPTFDDPTVSFDDASVFFDGYNISAYTNVAKPIVGDPYVNIPKPT